VLAETYIFLKNATKILSSRNITDSLTHNGVGRHQVISFMSESDIFSFTNIYYHFITTIAFLDLIDDRLHF